MMVRLLPKLLQDDDPVVNAGVALINEVANQADSAAMVLLLPRLLPTLSSLMLFPLLNLEPPKSNLNAV